MKKKKIKTVIIIILICFLVISAAAFYRIEKNFPEVATRYCDNIVVAKMSELLNRALLESPQVEKNNDIISVTRDSKGNIDLITVDTNKVNLLKSIITLEIIEALEKQENISFGIPLGNAMGSYAFSGMGPKIPVKAIPVGSVVSKIKSSFVSGGINQTKYELYIEFIVCIEVTAPFTTETRELTGELCIAQTVIVGKAPGVVWGRNH